MTREDINFTKKLIADYAKKIIMRAELNDKKFDINDAKDMEFFASVMLGWCKKLVGNVK